MGNTDPNNKSRKRNTSSNYKKCSPTSLKEPTAESTPRSPQFTNEQGLRNSQLDAPRKKTLQNDTVPTYQNDIVALHQLVHLSLAKQPKAGTRSLQANTNGWSREINQNDDALTNPNDIVKVTSASLPPAGSPVATHYSQQPLAAGSIRNTQNAAFQLHRTTSPRLPADDKYYFKNHQQLVTQSTHILHNDPKPADALNQTRRRAYTNKSSRCTYKTSRCTRKILAAGYHIRQSGPRPDPRLLRQTALEVLTRSARSDSPRKTRPEQNSGEVGRRRRLEEEREAAVYALGLG
ncbi:hypothetical protein F511_35720 [Dorcoceras hygrometricum]|uniref:Uncharacterized protein n=1 Tax=Dorcoceras hygrometricum TaxID=472368 RepID=A0A2Z7CIZ3_9LAMI|nr:hypothetical protein F511_35720 [Dorcoceras hygrometricum]